MLSFPGRNCAQGIEVIWVCLHCRVNLVDWGPGVHSPPQVIVHSLVLYSTMCVSRTSGGKFHRVLCCNKLIYSGSFPVNCGRTCLFWVHREFWEGIGELSTIEWLLACAVSCSMDRLPAQVKAEPRLLLASPSGPVCPSWKSIQLRWEGFCV